MVAKVIARWLRAEPATSVERVAVETGRSTATVRRWIASDDFEPRIADVLRMERFKPGLVEALLKLRVKPAGK